MARTASQLANLKLGPAHSSPYSPQKKVKNLETLEDIRIFRKRMINLLLQGKVSSRVGAVISTLLTGVSKDIELEKIQGEIREIKEQIKKRKKRNLR